MPHTHDHTTSAIVSFAIAPEITRSLDQAAGAELLSRSAYLRRVLIEHLRRQGLVGAETPILSGRRNHGGRA